MVDPRRIAIFHCFRQQGEGQSLPDTQNTFVHDSKDFVLRLSCGGCPGVDLVPAIEAVLEQGIETIHFDSSMMGDRSNSQGCANFRRLQTDLLDRFESYLDLDQFSLPPGLAQVC